MRVDHLAFYVSLFLSRLAGQVLLFLVPLVVFQTTQSAAWAGIAFFAETLPRFLAFPVYGALSDRLSPLRLLRISQAWRAAVCVGGVVAFELLGGIGWLIALSAVCGVLTTVQLAAPQVVGPAHWLQPLKTALAHVWRLPGLKQVIVLAAGVNLVVGVTLATSAA